MLYSEFIQDSLRLNFPSINGPKVGPQKKLVGHGKVLVGHSAMTDFGQHFLHPT